MRNSLQRIIALTIKELLAILKDKRSRILLVVPPMLQLFIFGYAASFDLNDIPIAIYNEDNSAPSRDLVAQIIGSPHFHLYRYLANERQIKPLIDNKDVLVVLHIASNPKSR